MMKENLIQVICGPGKGKTASALGRGVTALLKGKTVIMVQFLKGSMETEGMEIVKRLEPEFKLFRFEKSPIFFAQLSEEEKDEARINIRNGLNFAKKVLVTGECDILILDEPTAVLTPQETEELFEQLKLLREHGHTIIFISHKLNEVKALCNRMTILRDGKTMGTYEISDLDEREISRLMVGRDAMRKRQQKIKQCNRSRLHHAVMDNGRIAVKRRNQSRCGRIDHKPDQLGDGNGTENAKPRSFFRPVILFCTEILADKRRQCHRKACNRKECKTLDFCI